MKFAHYSKAQKKQVSFVWPVVEKRHEKQNIRVFKGWFWDVILCIFLFNQFSFRVIFVDFFISLLASGVSVRYFEICFPGWISCCEILQRRKDTISINLRLNRNYHTKTKSLVNYTYFKNGKKNKKKNKHDSNKFVIWVFLFLFIGGNEKGNVNVKSYKNRNDI